MDGRTFTIFLSLISLVKTQHLVTCQSCFAQCPPGSAKDHTKCDCEQDYCMGKYCFVKIEIFHKENVAAIQKGCTSEPPGAQSGCNYAGNNESIHCYCEGSYCNEKASLDNYRPRVMPLVDCCQCQDSKGDTCPPDRCARTCAGNYCIMDFVSLDQGCGMGYPKLLGFLRNDDFRGLVGKTTCVRYVAGRGTIVHGCSCSNLAGGCNVYKDALAFDQERVVPPEDPPLYQPEMNYCYSVHRQRRSTINGTVFKKSRTCEGKFCFVSITTVEIQVVSEDYDDSGSDLKYTAQLKPFNELMAGCLDVDDESKVQVGCSSEFRAGSGVPLQKHCICKSHMCNYYDLISDENPNLINAHPRAKSIRPTKTTTVKVFKRPTERPIMVADENRPSPTSSTMTLGSNICSLLIGLLIVISARS